MIYTENRTIVAHEGNDTRLSAEFCSNPMVNKVFWIASDRVIRPGTALGQITAHSITVSLKQYVNYRIFCFSIFKSIRHQTYTFFPLHSSFYNVIDFNFNKPGFH